MLSITDKRYLQGLNDIADSSLSLINEIEGTNKQHLQISTEFLLRLTHGYMYLYTKVIEDGLMPSPITQKQFTQFIH